MKWIQFIYEMDAETIQNSSLYNKATIDLTRSYPNPFLQSVETWSRTGTLEVEAGNGERPEGTEVSR
jgi:hypothetical protein